MALIVGLIVLACTVVVIGVLLRIGAAVLGVSVSLTNGVLGGRDLHEDDCRHRGSADEAIPRPRSLGGVRIPMPGVGSAVLVNIGCWVASVVCQLGASTLAVMAFGMSVPATADPQDPAAVLAAMPEVLAVSIGASVFGTVVMLRLALPTTFVRAMVVVFWQYVIAAVVGALLVGVLFALGAMNGGPVSVPTRPEAGGWVR